MSEFEWIDLVQSALLLVFGGALTAGGSYLADKRHAARERENREIARTQVIEDAARDHLARVYDLCEELIERIDLQSKDAADLRIDPGVSEIRRLSGLLPDFAVRSRVTNGVFILAHWSEFAEYPDRAKVDDLEFFHIVRAIRETVASKLRGEDVPEDSADFIDKRIEWHDEKFPF